MMALSKVTYFWPSGVSTRSLFDDSNIALPCITLTPRILARLAMPEPSFSRMDSFQARRRFRSIVASPKLIPRWADSLAAVIMCEALSSALDGMHPRFMQTPPSRGSRSMSRTFLPRSAA